MNTPAEISSTESSVKKGISRRFAQVLIFFILQAALLFWCSGRIGWTWAWIYLGICLLSVFINGTIMLRKSPETIAERGKPQWTKTWDKIISVGFAASLYLVLPIVAGLDVRYEWTGTMGTLWHAVGAALLALGLGIGGWAMISNAFFSTAARIQTDRNQTVCNTGPYRFVRHPGYAGFILQSLATAVVLGSLWALIPAFAGGAFLFVRTIFEDRMLQAELTGYSDYVKEVRYRLVPGIW